MMVVHWHVINIEAALAADHHRKSSSPPHKYDILWIMEEGGCGGGAPFIQSIVIQWSTH